MRSIRMVVHTTVSSAPLLAANEPHVIRKGAELTLTVSLNAGLALPGSLELVAQLINEAGEPITKLTEEGMPPLSSVTHYLLRPGMLGAELRPRINVLSSAFEGADAPFRICVSAINDTSIDPCYSPRLVSKSKWPAKSKRDASAAPAPAQTAGSPDSTAGGLVSPSESNGPREEANASASHSGSTSGERGGGQLDLSLMAALDVGGSEPQPRQPSLPQPRQPSLPLPPPLAPSAQPLAGKRLNGGSVRAPARVSHSSRAPAAPAAAAMVEGGGLSSLGLGLGLGLGAEGALGEESDEAALELLLGLLDDDELLAAVGSDCPAPLDELAPPAPQPPQPQAQPRPVHAVMPQPPGRHHRPHPTEAPPVVAESGEAQAQSFCLLLEESRRKRRPLLAFAPPPPSLGLPGPGLPAWLDRVSLSKASGFLCLEAALASSQTLGARVAQASGEPSLGCARTPLELRVRWCSANLNSALGVPLDALLSGAELLSVFAPETRERVGALALQLVASRSRLALDGGLTTLLALLPDGRRFAASVHLLLHADGTPEGSLAIPTLLLLARVHSHALGEGPLRILEPPPRVAIEERPGEAVRHLLGGRVHYASPSVADFCGFAPFHFLGRQAGCSVHPDDAARWFAYKLEVARSLRDAQGQWVSHVFTHRHVHRQRGWVWTCCHTQSRVAQPGALTRQPQSLHDSLVIALQEVIVRTWPVDVEPEQGPLVLAPPMEPRTRMDYCI